MCPSPRRPRPPRAAPGSGGRPRGKQRAPLSPAISKPPFSAVPGCCSPAYPSPGTAPGGGQLGGLRSLPGIPSVLRGAPPPPRAWPSAPEGRGGSPFASRALFMAGSALCPRAPNVTCSSRCVTSPSCNGGGVGGDGASGRDAFCNISN